MAVLGAQHQTQGAHQQEGSHRIYVKGTTDSFMEDMMKKESRRLSLRKKGKLKWEMGIGEA